MVFEYTHDDCWAQEARALAYIIPTVADGEAIHFTVH